MAHAPPIYQSSEPISIEISIRISGFASQKNLGQDLKVNLNRGSQNGAGIVEALVAAGILLFGGLAFLTIATSQFEAQKNTEKRASLNSKLEDMKVILKDPEACPRAFKNESKADLTFPKVKPIPAILPGPVKLSAVVDPFGAVGAPPILEVGKLVFDGGDLTLDKLTLADKVIPILDGTTIRRWVTVKLELTKPGSNPIFRESPILRVSHSQDGGFIASCSAGALVDADAVPCPGGFVTPDGSCHLDFLKASNIEPTDTKTLRTFQAAFGKVPDVKCAKTTFDKLDCDKVEVYPACPTNFVTKGCSYFHDDWKNDAMRCPFVYYDQIDNKIVPMTDTQRVIMAAYESLSTVCNAFCVSKKKYRSGKFSNCEDSKKADGTLQWSPVECECFF